MTRCAEQKPVATFRSLDIRDKMAQRLKDVGFGNIHQHDFGLPVGSWPEHEVMKLVGGLYANAYYLLEKNIVSHLTACNWSELDVLDLLNGVRVEIRSKDIHAYMEVRRVWAQKPF